MGEGSTLDGAQSSAAVGGQLKWLSMESGRGDLGEKEIVDLVFAVEEE